MAEAYKRVNDTNYSLRNIIIPDPLCERAGMNIEWAGALKFGVHAYHSAYSQSKTDRKSQFAPCEDKVHNVRARSVLFHPIARKLVNESSGYFLHAAQTLAKKDGTSDFPMKILKTSRKYRSVLRVCLQNFQSESETCDPADRTSYIEHIPTFYNMELVWHLCEIMFLEPLPGMLVVSPLISWIRFHVPYVEKEAVKLLDLDKGEAEKNEKYWLVMTDCVLQRKTETVRALLSVHSKANTEPFEMIDQILRTMPTFEVYGGLSGAEFKLRHDCWRKEASRIQRTGIFSNYKYLDVIAKIVIADESVQETVKKHCSTWYQHMVATLTYDLPAARVFDLSYYANKSITIYGGPNKISQLDWILCALLEMDIYTMVERSLQWDDSAWLLTHLVHLLHLIGKLHIPTSPEAGNEVFENILLDYGTLLMSHPSLWQVGVDYLDHCPKRGRGVLEALLERVPFSTDTKALKIIQIAKDRDLFEVAHTVCHVQGRRYQSRGQLGAALAWAIRSQDTFFCTHLADQFLKRYIEKGEFDCLDLLENLGYEMSYGDRLVFLGKYCEYLRLLKAGDLKMAGSLLVVLLKNKVVPSYFLDKVFKDALPFLENVKMQIFLADEIYQLMNSLKTLVDCAEKDGKEVDTKFVLKIRSALAQNLATALVNKHSDQ